jgi:hypothetical protein
MKLKAIPLLIIGLYSSLSFGNTPHAALCTTTTYQAFGEPPKTIRDCAEDFEGFALGVTVNNLVFTTMLIGLEIPQAEQEQYNGNTATLTGQVTKAEKGYKVRIQASFNNETINYSIIMMPNETKSIALNGNNVIIKLAKQVQ